MIPERGGSRIVTVADSSSFQQRADASPEQMLLLSAGATQQRLGFSIEPHPEFLPACTRPVHSAHVYFQLTQHAVSPLVRRLFWQQGWVVHSQNFDERHIQQIRAFSSLGCQTASKRLSEPACWTNVHSQQTSSAHHPIEFPARCGYWNPSHQVWQAGIYEQFEPHGCDGRCATFDIVRFHAASVGGQFRNWSTCDRRRVPRGRDSALGRHHRGGVPRDERDVLPSAIA